MGMINSNLPSFSASQNLQTFQSRLGHSIESLSSGLRLNHAADGAAALAISQYLTSQLTGTNQAVQNIQDSVSLVQTADGAMSQIGGTLDQMSQLAVQAGDGALAPSQRQSIQNELTQLAGTINTIAANTSFNGQSLLNGVAQTVSVRNMVGNDVQELSFNRVGVKIDVSTGASAATAAQVLTGLAGGTTSFTTSAGQGSVSVQTGPNAGSQTGVNLPTVSASALGLSASNLNVMNPDNVQNVIGAVGNAIDQLSSQRANLGAIQNNLSATASSLTVAAENLASTQSAIQDTNVAAASTALATNQILAQGATSVLAQSNLSQQTVLNLLR